VLSARAQVSGVRAQETGKRDEPWSPLASWMFLLVFLN